MTEGNVAAAGWLDLYDWRRRVAELYREREAALRLGTDGSAVLAQFRAARDALFTQHPQSPLEAAARSHFSGLRYFAYEPALSVQATLEPLELDDAEQGTDAPTSQPGGADAMPLRRAARVQFTVDNVPAVLTLYWIDVYGGGLFLPFRDATCPDESYGAGRYLCDTAKGSDFLRLDDSGAIVDASAWGQGYSGGRVVLDFNYAYNPSCAYDPRWLCPLAPRENWLPLPIRAGERKYLA